MKKYKVFKCPYCGNHGVTTGKVFKCKFCNRSRKIQQENKFGLQLQFSGSFDHPTDATRVCQELNGLRNRGEVEG